MATEAVTTDRTTLGWLTPEIRRAVYGVVAALLTLGVAVGWVTGEQQASLLGLADQALGIAAAVLAFVHTGGTYRAPVVSAAAEPQAD